jgi:hypothetical protein
VNGKLLERLQDIAGVASVALDLDDIESGISVRLEPDANEVEVLERVRALLVAYGVSSHENAGPIIGGRAKKSRMGVEIRITPIRGGARVEVIGPAIRSFRVVVPKPVSVAQGVADAWCQVVGRPPVEITRAGLNRDGVLEVVAVDGDTQRHATADLGEGWQSALGLAVGEVIGVLDSDLLPEDENLARAGW